MTKLTLKQQRFADEYIRLGDATKAAVSAGYSTKTASVVGSENIRKPNIKVYIDKRLEELKKQSIAQQDEVLQYLTSVMRGEVTDQELIPIGIGKGEMSVEKLEKRSDTNARTKAAELLGKRYRLFTDKQEVEHTGSVQFVDDIE